MSDSLKHRLASAIADDLNSEVLRRAINAESVEIQRASPLELTLRVMGQSGMPRYFILRLSEPM
jgi:hypothetical protein